MGNIPFVPKRYIFKSGKGIPLHESCHAADPFRFDGISFMGHGRGSFLLGTEIFFRFPYLRSLQMADFQGNLCQCARDDAEGGNVFRMMVALYDLGRYDFRSQSHFFADVFFHIWINIRISTDSAGQFPHRHFRSGPLHSFDIS